MRIVVTGGTGQLGTIVEREFRAAGHEVSIIGRSVADAALRWDGRTLGPWAAAIDGADVVVNLAGRSVNCRYTWANLNEMMASRVDTTVVVGQAIAAAARPPRVWLQASTASIYAHTLGEPHTEASGQLGGHEPDVPDYWAYSTHIGKAWELALAAADTPPTRKVAMRMGFTMSPDAGGVFDWLCWMVEVGLGGPFCGGEQSVSWIGDHDLAAAMLWLVEHDLEGPVNLTAPHPISNRAFMGALCDELGARVRLGVTPWMASVGAAWLHTDRELMLKSRRVVPERLLASGFTFAAPTWEEAVGPLVKRRAA